MNPRPLAPQASALAGLRYAPTEIGIQPAERLPEQLCLSITKILTDIRRDELHEPLSEW